MIFFLIAWYQTMVTQQDDDDPMGDTYHCMHEIKPPAQSRRGEEKRRRPESPSSGEEVYEPRRPRRSPSPGELEEQSRANRSVARESCQRRDGVGTSSNTTESWGIDGQGNLVHRTPCKICKTYALHVYNHAFNRDNEYLNAKNVETGTSLLEKSPGPIVVTTIMTMKLRGSGVNYGACRAS
jgi:hypothetical protein